MMEENDRQYMNALMDMALEIYHDAAPHRAAAERRERQEEARLDRALEKMPCLYSHPNLSFNEEGELSERVAPEVWRAISQFFAYHTYRDLAEWYEDIDDFFRAEEYRQMGRGGRWALNRGKDVTAMERILGIAPENTLAAQREREQAREQAAARERQAAAEVVQRKQTLFAREQGEYVLPGPDFDGRVVGQRIPWGNGFTIFGTGEEFIIEEGEEFIWLCVNNGSDGATWSNSNLFGLVIGYRYPATEERLAFLRALQEEALR